MKKILTLIAATALTFLGTSVQSEARPHHGYHAPASTVFVSGYRYGRPVYTENTSWDMIVGVALYLTTEQFNQEADIPHEAHTIANRRILPVTVGGITHREAA